MNEIKIAQTASEPPLVRHLHAIGRRLGAPISGTFELTAGCNFNCPACYIHQKDARVKPEKELSAAQWLQIGKEAAEAGTVFLLLTGGEPLLRPDFAEIYTGLKKLGLMISVNTNGSLLTGDVATLLERNPPMRLNVSLYADSETGYCAACGAAGFDRVISNIRRMKDAGVEVKLNVSFSQANADRAQHLSALIRKLGLHCQATTYLYPPVRATGGAAADSPARLSPQDAAKLRIQWDLLQKKNEKLERSASLLAQLSSHPCEDGDLPAEGVRCRAGHTSYWIDAEGRMMMCGMIPIECGSVPEEGFDLCWQNVRAMTKTIRMPKKCTACSLRPVCCVCPAACRAETGDFQKAPDYLCAMSRELALQLTQLEQEDPGK